MGTGLNVEFPSSNVEVKMVVFNLSQDQAAGPKVLFFLGILEGHNFNVWKFMEGYLFIKHTCVIVSNLCIHLVLFAITQFSVEVLITLCNSFKS